MNTNQHTPGPWEIDLDEGIIFHGDDEEIAHVHDPCDVNLIAAAPELLEALKESFMLWENILEQLEYLGVADSALSVKGTSIEAENFAAMLTQSKAAIAKAEGRAGE